jgi:ABC-2 type transport system permease protein
MLATIKAEFRKLLTIRSTYFIVALALLLTGFIAFYGMGYKSEHIIPANMFREYILNCVSIVQVFGGIVAILLITHEYRYNTIAYTLTSSNSRLKVLLSKMLVVTVFAVILSVVAAAFVGALIALGAHFAHHSVITTGLDYGDIALKSTVFTVTGVLAALVIGFLARSVVFAIVAYFLIPTTVEPLLNNLLKVSTNYLPFMAQNQIIMNNAGDPKVFSPLASAGVFCAYILGAWIIATFFFVRKDAN